MDRQLLDAMIWLLFLGGIFGMAMGLWKFLTNGVAAEYAIMGIGGGLYMLFSVAAIYVKGRRSAA